MQQNAESDGLTGTSWQSTLHRSVETAHFSPVHLLQVRVPVVPLVLVHVGFWVSADATSHLSIFSRNVSP